MRSARTARTASPQSPTESPERFPRFQVLPSRCLSVRLWCLLNSIDPPASPESLLTMQWNESKRPSSVTSRLELAQDTRTRRTIAFIAPPGYLRSLRLARSRIHLSLTKERLIHAEEKIRPILKARAAGGGK
jgi:hypothetical protein